MATSATPPQRLNETASMILTWLRLAVPSILHNSGHSTSRSSKQIPPVATLQLVLQDAVVLADLLSLLDDRYLPPTTILRSSGRGAMSSPLPHPSSTPPSNIDARQLHVQYKQNTRRIVDALKRLLPDVRRYARVSQTPPPGAVDAFVQNVADIPPSKDIWPTIRLAELAIAAALYGPRHNQFRHTLWQFPTDVLRKTFLTAMTTVAQNLGLPSPEVLFKGGPAPPSPTVMSPHALPPPMAACSPHLSPSFSAASPRYALSPNYIPTPHLPIPTSAAHIVSSPLHHPGYSPRTPVYGPPFSPQRYKTPPLPPHKPYMHAPHSAPPPQTTSVPTAVLSPRGNTAAAVTTTTTTKVQRSTNTTSSHMLPSPTGSAPLPATATSSAAQSHIVGISSRNVPDASTSPLEAPPPSLHTSVDDGLNARKFSMVTDDSGSRSTEISPLPGFHGGFSKVESRTAANFEDFKNMSSVTEQGVSVGPSGPSNYGAAASSVAVGAAAAAAAAAACADDSRGDRFDDYDAHSGGKSSDGGFYTPREYSPSHSDRDNQPAPPSSVPMLPPSSSSKAQKPSRPVVAAAAAAAAAAATAAAAAAIAAKAGSSSVYSDSKVDEVVRQSVTTSVTQQASRPQQLFTRNTSVGSGSVDRENTSEDETKSNRTSGAPIDFTNPAFQLSPSMSEAPFPSNQWQISRSKNLGQDIASPQSLFSPPQMPRRHSRNATATQVPPTRAPRLFKSGTSSPQLSLSSTGTRSYVDVEQEQAPKARSTSASARSAQSGGAPPRSSASSSRASPASSRAARSSRNGSKKASSSRSSSSKQGSAFSLPPSASESPDRHRQRSRDSSPRPIPVVSESHTSAAAQRDMATELFGRDPMATPQNVQLEPLHDDDDISAIEEALSDRAIFQRVEEVLVSTSDYRPSAKEIIAQHEASSSREAGPSGSTDNHRPHDGNSPVIRPEQPLTAQSPTSQSRGNQGDSAALPAFEPTTVLSPKARGNVAGPSAVRLPVAQTKGTPRSRVLGGSSAASSVLATPEIKPSSALPPLAPETASSPAIRASSRKPPTYSTPVIPTDRRRMVPPTPPSPPAIDALIRKFSDQTPPPEPADSGNRPVSTMEPSPGLLQKLISVWQNSDDENREHGSVRSNILDGGLTPKSATLQPSGSGSQESTLPSGDTEIALGHGGGSTSMDSSKGRRPRAVRLTDARSIQVASESIMSPKNHPHDKQHHELPEGGSTASYSDVFSDDKERPWVFGAQSGDYRDEWDETLMKGDSSSGIHAEEPKAANPVTSSTDNSESGKPTMKASANPLQATGEKHVVTNTNGVDTDGNYIRVDKRRLDWLTRELLVARDTISRKDLQMTFAETQRMEQQEIMLLQKQEAESVVDAMKKILVEREQELRDARNRLSTTIQNVSTQERSSLGSRTSVGGNNENLSQLIRDGHAKLHTRIEEAETKQQGSANAMSSEMHTLWTEVQRAMLEKMTEMTERRDQELELLRQELQKREDMVHNLQRSSAELIERNRECEAEASEMRLETVKAAHRYELEMSHVTAQVELVNEFSKKLHDNFRETENLRQQVLHYQDKLSHITNTSGVSQRQIKELREAVTRANDECARLRREADMAKKKGMEAIRRAEELEDLRIKDEAAQVAGRYPDRRAGSDSASYQSNEPSRTRNRPGGSGGRYNRLNRTRATPGSPNPAHRAWLVIKDKIGGIVPSKDRASPRMPGQSYGGGGRRDMSRSGTVSQTSQSRSRVSQADDDVISRSTRSRTSNGSNSSIRGAGAPRTDRSNRSNEMDRVGSPTGSNPYMHSSPHSRGEGQSVGAGF